MIGADKLTAQKLIDEKTQLVGEWMKAQSSSFIFESVIGSNVDSLISKDFCNETTTGLDSKRGIRIERKRGQLTALSVERIYFKSATAVTALEITLTDGVTTETYEVTAEANEEVVIEVDFQTSSLWVDITYQDESVEPYIGSISPYHNFADMGCAVGCAGSCHSMKIRTIEDENYLIAYRGVRVDCSVKCDRSKMICLVAKDQALAFLYLVGAELMKELSFSDRINFLTISNKDEAKLKAEEWTTQANAMLVDNSQGIKRYLESQQKECFICNGYSYGHSKP